MLMNASIWCRAEALGGVDWRFIGRPGHRGIGCRGRITGGGAWGLGVMGGWCGGIRFGESGAGRTPDRRTGKGFRVGCMSERVTNWAGNVVFGAREVRRPGSVDEVREIVAGGGAIKVLGSGHSFNRMADTDGTLVSLAELPRMAEISADRKSVRVDGGIRYGVLAGHLYDNGLALHNTASL